MNDKNKGDLLGSWELIGKGQTSLSNSTTSLIEFTELLTSSQVDLDKLRTLSWNGIPSECRAVAWRLLLGYSPTDQSREHVLNLKRNKYLHLKKRHLGDNINPQLMEQIRVDVVRTQPNGYKPLFKEAGVQQLLERVLYIYASEHSSVGYIQGMGDIASAFIIVFISSYCDPQNINESFFMSDAIHEVEADAYWCLKQTLTQMQNCLGSNLFDSFQPFKTKLRELLSLVDPNLIVWLDANNLDLAYFTVRWYLLLLFRELPTNDVLRLWDTYFSEGHFTSFHVYVCASLLVHFSNKLKQMDFNDGFIFLQNLPTSSWERGSVEKLLNGAMAIAEIEQKFVLTQSFALHLVVTSILFLLMLVFQFFLICLYMLSLL